MTCTFTDMLRRPGVLKWLVYVCLLVLVLVCVPVPACCTVVVFQTPLAQLGEYSGPTGNNNPKRACHWHQGSQTLLVAGTNVTAYGVGYPTLTGIHNQTRTAQLIKSHSQWGPPASASNANPNWVVWSIIDDPADPQHVYAHMGIDQYDHSGHAVVHVNISSMKVDSRLDSTVESNMGDSVGLPRFHWLWHDSQYLVTLTWHPNSDTMDTFFVSRVRPASFSGGTYTPLAFHDYMSGQTGQPLAACYNIPKQQLLVVLDNSSVVLIDVGTLTVLDSIHRIPHAPIASDGTLNGDDSNFDCSYDAASNSFIVLAYAALVKVEYTSATTIMARNSTGPYTPYQTTDWLDVDALYAPYLDFTVLADPSLGVVYLNGVTDAGSNIAIVDTKLMVQNTLITFQPQVPLVTRNESDTPGHWYIATDQFQPGCLSLDSQKGFLYGVDAHASFLVRADVSVGICPPNVTSQSCSPCPPGTFSTWIPLSGALSGRTRLSCEPCPLGTASNRMGAAQCDRCNGPGQFTTTTGQTSCDMCSSFATYSASESSCVCEAGAQALKLVGKMVECAPCSGATYKSDVGNGGCMPCTAFSRAVDGRSCACVEGYYSSSLLSTDQGLLACDGNQACCVKCPVEGSCLDVKVGPLPGYWWAEQSAYNAGLLRASANATNATTDTDTNPDTNTNTNTSSTSNTTTATRMGSGSGTLNLNLRIVHFFPCSPPEACTSTGCARGYTGFLCGECDAQAGYATDGSLQRCVSASGTNASLFAIVTLVGVAVTGYLFRASVRARSLVPLIILINYAQLATEADIGSDLYRFVTALQFNMFTIGAGQSLVTGSFSSIWLLDLFLPMALHGLAWGWYAAFKAQDHIRATYFPGVGPASLSPSRGPDRGHQLLLTHMSIFLFTFLGCTKTALQIFNCKQIDGRVVLAVHPGMTCWESTHNGLVTVSVIYLVIFVVCIPSLLAAVLLKPKWLPKRLAVLDMGFMKATYRAERYWWELVMLAVRVAYAVVVVSFSSSPFFRTCALLLLTFLVSSIHVWHRPYRSRVDNTLQTGALQVLHLCFIITLVWQQDVTQNTTGCSIALFVVNVFVFVCAMSLVMRVLVHRVTGKRVLELDDNENENENQSGPAKALGTGTGIGTGAGTGKALAGQDGDGDGDGDAFMQVAPAIARTGKASILAQSIELQHPQPQHAPSAAITSTPSASARYVSPADSPAPLHPHPHPHPTSPSSFNTWHPSHRPAHSTLQHTQFEPLHSPDSPLNRPPVTLPRPNHHHGMPSFSAAHTSNTTINGVAGASAGVDVMSDSDSFSRNPLHDPSRWQDTDTVQI